MIVEAEKSHSLPSSRWKTRKAGGIIDLDSKGPNFPGGASGKELAYQCRRCKRRRSSSGSGRSPGEGHGNPLQYSFLENPMNSGAWHVAESDTTEATYHTCTYILPWQWQKLWSGLVRDTTIPGLSHPDMRVWIIIYQESPLCQVLYR